MKQWYQSFGSHPWETPTSGFQSGRYLLRETPKRINQWSAKRKMISPKGKQMLTQKVLSQRLFLDRCVSMVRNQNANKILDNFIDLSNYCKVTEVQIFILHEWLRVNHRDCSLRKDVFLSLFERVCTRVTTLRCFCQEVWQLQTSRTTKMVLHVCRK